MGPETGNPQAGRGAPGAGGRAPRGEGSGPNPAGAQEALGLLRARGLSPLLEAVAERYRKRGRLTGLLPLGSTGLDAPAREALEALMGGRLSRRRDRLYVNLDHLEQALRRSRFETTLDAVLHAAYGGMRTRAEERELRDRTWAVLLDRLQAGAPGERSRAFWVRVMKGGPSRTLQRARRAFLEGWRRHASEVDAGRALGGSEPAWLQDLQAMLRTLSTVIEGLPRWRGSRERLPLFSTRVSGDAHALDADRPLGQILLHSLADLAGGEAPDPDEVGPTFHRDWLLDWAGLGRDDLSPTVLVVGADEGLGLPLALPLYTVQRLPELLPAQTGMAHVVENPSVFGAILDRILDRLEGARRDLGRAEPGCGPSIRPALICTSGQLNLAGFHLLDRLARQGATLHYSGDFDVGGLHIAALALRRWPRSVRLWRMDPQSYGVALGRSGGGHPFSETERLQLERLAGSSRGPDAPVAELAGALLRRGVRAFQEALVDELAGDVEAAGGWRGSGGRTAPG
ncbi:DUF2399 domain-containing protein [Limnochorda pilosa]|uniref:TIGR02679 family protein n=1 Tax=Limnochorda pilosa TaxID=1555112 RepID=A0A0K2SLR1_LIMPI|nr:DUF2399 domain-containing protein [Limnochorda pilosa]BAS27947.1 hypothetical protein LIP_2106 [Limnochorda pilosa]